ncbi:MAG: AraC family transcriptional regulator [Clostridia bacterium]|nr:AraC family transcriptional regulator [Clostridia bacterium]
MQNKYKIKLLNHNTNKAFVEINDIPHYYEITIVLEGEFVYEIDGKEYNVSAGDGIFVRQGQRRHRLPCKEEPSYYSINFFCLTDETPDLPTILKNCVTSEVKRLLQLMDVSFKERFIELREDMLYHYICLIIMQLQNVLIKSSMNPYINTMLKYISEHITEKIGLEDVAKSVNLSVSHCCYLFKKEMNITIYDIIIKERVYLAQEYILSGELTLKQISVICGFYDYSHFLKSFKKVTGILPSDYKA